MASKICPCGQTFYKTPSTSQRKWDIQRKYCTVRCRAIYAPSPKKGKTYPHLWRDNVNYTSLHLQVYKKYGKAKRCSRCDSTENVQWANKSNKYEGVDDFIQLCASCHKKYDIKMNKTIPWNKGIKTGHTPWNKGLHVRLNPKGEFKKGQIPHNKKGRFIACKTCGNNFWVKPSEINKTYCSPNCWYKRNRVSNSDMLY